MDLRKLKTLIDLVAESDIAELEVTEGESKVRIVKSSSAQHQVVMMPQAMSAPAQAMAPAAPAVAAPAEAAVPTGHVVKSPMVGTFYRAAEPTAAPFVNVGDTVRKNQVLCLIEAMKLMNEIVSEYDGEIVQVFVENGQPVQYGERLFAVRAR